MTAPDGQHPGHPLASGPLTGFLADSESCPVGRLDADGVVTAANPALRRWIGPGSRLADVLLPTSIRRWGEVLAELAQPGRSRSVRIELDLGAGRPNSAPFRCLVWRAEDGSIWLFGELLAEVIEPIAAEILALQGELARLNRRLLKRTIALERARAEVESLALTDPLTGLANRRQGDLWLHEAVALANLDEAPLSCLMVDLDHFKRVNDTFGHPVGDLVLREAAQALAENVRPSDPVMRDGGEEFVVLLRDLPGCGRDAGRAAPGQDDRAGRPPLPHGIGASFGVACLRRGESPGSLLARADAALGRASAGARAGRARGVRARRSSIRPRLALRRSATARPGTG